MLKHLEDEGDLNMIIDNGGNLLIVCPKCRTVWHGKFTPAMLPGHPGPPGGAVVSPKGAAATAGAAFLSPRVIDLSKVLSGQPGDKMMTAYMEKSDLLKDAGIDIASLDDLKPI
jgi:hypothetical protein